MKFVNENQRRSSGVFRAPGSYLGLLTNEGEEGWFETTRRSIVRIYAALSLSFWPPGLRFWPSCVGASAGARFGGAAGLRARREVGTK